MYAWRDVALLVWYRLHWFINIYFREAVVEVLFYQEHGLASRLVHPLKLTKKHILPYERILVVISYDSTIIRSQNGGCLWSVTRCKKV